MVVYWGDWLVGERVLNWVCRKAVVSEANWADWWVVVMDGMLVEEWVGCWDSKRAVSMVPDWELGWVD